MTKEELDSAIEATNPANEELKDVIIRNKKTGKEYDFGVPAINATNGDHNGTVYILYCDLEAKQVYIRELMEFMEKYDLVSITRLYI